MIYVQAWWVLLLSIAAYLEYMLPPVYQCVYSHTVKLVLLFNSCFI